MFDKDAGLSAARMYQQGHLPSDILRFFALQTNEVTVSDLMQLMREAFSLSYEDVQCIGGWWPDGTGELTDEQLNAFLFKAIQRAGNRCSSH